MTDNIVSIVRKHSKLKAELDTKITRYEGEDKPDFHLLSLNVSNFMRCPYCSRKFTTADPKKLMQPRIKHEINEDYSTICFEAICFKCAKEFRFDLFTGWYSDGQFDISFTVEEQADLTGIPEGESQS